MTAETQQRYGEAPAWSPRGPKLGLGKLVVAWIVSALALVAAATIPPDSV
jgi:hypothetical protein